MAKHGKTLAAVFEQPPRSDVRWADFVALAEARGCQVKPGAGSRFRFAHGEVRAVIHRPRPGEQMSKAQLRSARDFLDAAGIRPDASGATPTKDHPPTKQGGQ